MPKFSVKKPLTVFVAVLAILGVGRGSLSKDDTGSAAQHGLPLCGHCDHRHGGQPETVEADVTKPLEQPWLR